MLARRVSLVATAGAIALLVAGAPFSQGKVLADQFTQQIQSLSAQAGALSRAIASLSATQVRPHWEMRSHRSRRSRTRRRNLRKHSASSIRPTRTWPAPVRSSQVVHSEYTADQANLGQILKHVYELTDDGSVTAILVDSKSFIDAMDALTSADQVSTRVQQLVTQIQGKRDQLDALQKQQQADQVHANALVASLRDAGRSAAERGGRIPPAGVIAEGQGRHVAGATAGRAVEDRRGASRAGSRGRSRGGGGRRRRRARRRERAAGRSRSVPAFDDYPWGQCTWYVASLRNVYWSGNAWEWAYTARAAGRPEGMTPRVGSLVVFGPGHGYSQFGHVAYVVSVQGPTSLHRRRGEHARSRRRRSAPHRVALRRRSLHLLVRANIGPSP